MRLTKPHYIHCNCKISFHFCKKILLLCCFQIPIVLSLFAKDLSPKKEDPKIKKVQQIAKIPKTVPKKIDQTSLTSKLPEKKIKKQEASSQEPIVKHKQLDTVYKIQQVDTAELFKQHLVNITQFDIKDSSKRVALNASIQSYYDKRIVPTLPKPNWVFYYFEKIMEIIGIVTLLIVLVFLLRSLRKKPNAVEKQTPKSATLSEKLDNFATTVNNRFEATDSRLANLNAQLGVVSVSPHLERGSYFFAEVMTSAGPRKSEEAGMGEDIAGVLVREDFACFWILDGVSDNHILKNQQGEFFSSRLLAQYIAWSLQTELLLVNDITFDLKSALKNACAGALKGIQERIDGLSDREKYAIKRAIENQDIPMISTTVMIGLLTKQGHLKICRIGVDKFVALPAGRYSNPKDENAPIDRIAFSLNIDSENLLVVRQSEINKQAIYVEALANVKTVIGATDGVSSQLLKWIKNQPQFDFAEPAFRQIIGNYSEKTSDDKAMCIIQIKDLVR